LLAKLCAIFSQFAEAAPAHAHAIAGDHYFPDTFTIDSPAVSDDLDLPGVMLQKHQADGGEVMDRELPFSVSRLLAPGWQFGIDSGYDWRRSSSTQKSGFEAVTLSLKSQILRDDDDESLATLGLGWSVGHSGAKGIGADATNSFNPGVSVGQGFGNLPQYLFFLRPVAVTGAIEAALPISRRSAMNLAVDPASGGLFPQESPATDRLHWGFAISYSTHYIQDWGPHWPYQHEPLNQFVPLVEFSFDSANHAATTGTANPGLVYVGECFQFLVEASLPLNQATGRTVGAQMQLTWFLDELLPALFEKPLLSR
jgi:hypothetical protein